MMKQHFAYPFSLLLLLVTLLICAQPLKAELFWTYEKDGQQGYLLGSVHFANESFYPLDKRVMAAYERSSVLVVEVDEKTIAEDERQRLIAAHGFYANNQTLKDHLSPKTLRIIEGLLKEFGIPLEAVKNYQPGLLAITITALQAEKLGYKADQGVDQYFMQKARYKKNIRQIEDFAFQMALLSKLPADDLILQDSFNDMYDYKTTWSAMMSAWKRGDGDELYKQAIADPLKDYPGLVGFFDVLFFDRHPRMVNSANQCVKNKETCFLVVGAGHMLGEKGIVAELIRQGYRVTQLKAD
jgi:uncharacterized protein YbaP (TraB family)